MKWKVLLVCRHVAIKGSPQFKVTMLREHLGPIKQHLQFGGPQDPIRGDEANQRVRDVSSHFKFLDNEIIYMIRDKFSYVPL